MGTWISRTDTGCPRLVRKKLCPNLCHTWLKIGPAEVVYGPAFRFHADMRVAFHHGARHVSCKSHNRRIRSLRFGQSRNKQVAEIVEAARDVCGLAGAFPGDFPAVHRFRGDNLVGAQLPVVSGEAVRLMWENIVLPLGSRATVRGMTRPVPAAVFDLPTVSDFARKSTCSHLRPRISLALMPVFRALLT